MPTQTQQTFDPDIQISFGGVRGMDVEIVNGKQEPVREWYLLTHYQIARDGWFEALEALAAAHDANEQLLEQIAEMEEAARIRELDDYDRTVADFEVGTGRV